MLSVGYESTSVGNGITKHVFVCRRLWRLWQVPPFTTI